MKILVTGGCGYVGSELIPSLLKKGHKITVYDTQWFGSNLEEHNNLKVVKIDTRQLEEKHLKGFEKIIHLANIANDPAVDLNPELSWEVNVLATQQLIDKAARLGTTKQFIFASSGSVYGVKEEPNVTEELSLVPISAYNKTKMVAERVLLSYAGHMKIHCIRPATVCGLSRRMRLDVAVNILTMQALEKKSITVFGGNQTRPNINIQDMVEVYHHFLENSELPSGTYNAGFENISILEIAELIAKKLDAKIIVKESNDPRSYRQDSSKLIKTGFVQKHTVEDAIDSLITAYQAGLLKNEDHFHTVKTMKNLGL